MSITYMYYFESLELQTIQYDHVAVIGHDHTHPKIAKGWVKQIKKDVLNVNNLVAFNPTILY